MLLFGAKFSLWCTFHTHCQPPPPLQLPGQIMTHAAGSEWVVRPEMQEGDTDGTATGIALKNPKDIEGIRRYVLHLLLSPSNGHTLW